MSILHPPPPVVKFLQTPMQLIDVRKDLFFQAVFPKNGLDEFWLSAYKSYTMFCVKATKIILRSAS